MFDCMTLLKPDAMVGHWEFTYGEDRVKELIGRLTTPSSPATSSTSNGTNRSSKSTIHLDRGGHRVAVIGQAMPYTPIANPRWMMPNWSFGIRPEVLAGNVDAARADGADVVVLLSHNGCDVDQKLPTASAASTSSDRAHS